MLDAYNLFEAIFKCNFGLFHSECLHGNEDCFQFVPSYRCIFLMLQVGQLDMVKNNNHIAIIFTLL